MNPLIFVNEPFNLVGTLSMLVDSYSGRKNIMPIFVSSPIFKLILRATQMSYRKDETTYV
jgi:hypothetical protein